MAYVQAAALVTRLREVLEDSRGVLRTVPASRFDGSLQEGLSDGEQMRRALTAPRLRADLTVMGRSRYSPPIKGNIIIYDINIVVTSIRTVTRDEQVDDNANDALVAAAIVDMDVIRQALEYPNNLLATEAGAATDLVSGMLSYQGSDIGVARAINDGAQMLESKHTFSGWLISRPAVS